MASIFADNPIAISTAQESIKLRKSRAKSEAAKKSFHFCIFLIHFSIESPRQEITSLTGYITGYNRLQKFRNQLNHNRNRAHA
jgi:hypothetical protein